MALRLGLWFITQFGVWSATSSRMDEAALYDGPFRPRVHFSPSQNFMNDPNGLFLDDSGIYHLYYQYNPSGIVGGNQHWGHATSSDLYHWVNQPIAIFPPTNDTQVFSGSAVVDVNNTSGFFPNQTNGVVAIYTLNTPRAQVQEIAYSLDSGHTFTRYAENPVVDINSPQFRDPKVIWHPDTQRWVMAIAYALESTIGFYTSPDLKTWTHASNFTQPAAPGTAYECPNLVQIPLRDPTAAPQPEIPGLPSASAERMYVLFISTNPRASPPGGSATQYFVGAFNGTHFTPADREARWTDFAKDNYAGQYFYGIPDEEDALSIAWAANLQYAGAVPTEREGWRSAMSLPRRTFLVADPSGSGWDLVSRPEDLSPVRGARLAATEDVGAEPFVVDYSAVGSNAVYFEANVTGLPADPLPSDALLNITFLSPATNESVWCACSFGGEGPFGVVLDRGETRGFDNPNFSASFSTTVLPRGDGTWALAGVVDRSIVEVFVNGGVQSATATFFATQPLTLVRVTVAGMPPGVSVSAAVYALESVWAGDASRA
ncbi:glycosyl hydrolase [Earliella scabrosa]|nr:glycosyl hydrolase [Earliella scabrosa]